MLSRFRSRFVAQGLRLATAVVVATGLAGCTMPPPDNGDGNGGNNGDEVQASIVAPATSFGISVLEDPISVFFTVTGPTGEREVDVSGYYVPLDVNEQGECIDPDGSAVGDRVIVESRTLEGDLDFFSFDPGDAGVGCYRLGVLVSVDGVELDPVDGDAVAEVQAPPDPSFVLPETDLTVSPSAQVLVRIDAGDPQNRVQWRLFILSETDSRDTTPDRLGTELLTGNGNVGEFILRASDFDPGSYEIGVSATDSGDSIVTTVTRGMEGRIVTIPDVTQTGRFLTISEPEQ